jgi:eukaryotic-like serine/threonine-protein kinase
MRRWPLQDGDLLAGKYRVERTLGSGGMGVVVAAWHVELEQRVALKLLRPEVAENADAAERFRREARAAVKIKSEHVARVLDVGTLDDGVSFMVMEYLEGNDLGDELKRTGPLAVAEAVEYLLQACEAVAEAHAAGIVHRDLKPANLFIASRPDGSRAVKVLDFGISKSLGESPEALSLTATSSMIGSPLYMSPEQMRSARDVDARTDIWSLGAILYQMLAGRPPYVADTMPQLCAALINDTPPSLESFRNDLPRGIDQVVSGCLKKERTRRCSTVAELARELAEFGGPEARMHAERIERLLGVSDVNLTSVERPRSVSDSAVPARTGTERMSEGGLGHATLDSWGRTGSPPAAGKLPRWVLFGGGGLLAVGLLSAYVLSRHSSQPAPAPATSASVTAPAPQTPLATPTQAAPSAPSAKLSPSVAVQEDAGSRAAPSADHEAAHVSIPTHYGAVHRVEHKSAGIPNFGGRH